VRSNHPFHLFPPAKKRVSEQLENVNKHHGVVVNYNTKSIASLFFTLAISSYLSTNKRINVATQWNALLQGRFLCQSRESPQDFASGVLCACCKNPDVHDWNN
jgi:hypothetical protein